MKIRTKVQAGRGCGGGSTPSIQQRRATQRPHNPGTPATVRPFSSQETIMKIKTKVKAGPRDCGGGKLPVAVDVQSDVHPAHLGAPPRSRGVQHRGASLPLSPNQETIMKIKTKVKAGPRDCGGGGSKLPVEQTV